MKLAWICTDEPARCRPGINGSMRSLYFTGSAAGKIGKCSVPFGNAEQILRSIHLSLCMQCMHIGALALDGHSLVLISCLSRDYAWQLPGCVPASTCKRTFGNVSFDDIIVVNFGSIPGERKQRCKGGHARLQGLCALAKGHTFITKKPVFRLGGCWNGRPIICCKVAGNILSG